MENETLHLTRVVLHQALKSSDAENQFAQRHEDRHEELQKLQLPADGMDRYPYSCGILRVILQANCCIELVAGGHHSQMALGRGCDPWATLPTYLLWYWTVSLYLSTTLLMVLWETLSLAAGLWVSPSSTSWTARVTSLSVSCYEQHHNSLAKGRMHKRTGEKKFQSSWRVGTDCLPQYPVLCTEFILTFNNSAVKQLSEQAPIQADWSLTKMNMTYNTLSINSSVILTGLEFSRKSLII